MPTRIDSLAANAATPRPGTQAEPIAARGRSAAATYRALLTSRFGHHGVAADGDDCRCGAPRPCDEERRIALLLEMDIGDEAWSAPPPAGHVATDARPLNRQLTGPMASPAPVSPSAGPAA
jgi:hypothetical protein